MNEAMLRIESEVTAFCRQFTTEPPGIVFGALLCAAQREYARIGLTEQEWKRAAVEGVTPEEATTISGRAERFIRAVISLLGEKG